AAGFLRSNDRRLAQYSAACALASLVLLTGVHLFNVNAFMSRHLAQLPKFDSSAKVVIVNWPVGYYSVDLVQNDPYARNQPLLMFSHGRPADAQMMSAQFPGLKLQSHSGSGTVWSE